MRAIVSRWHGAVLRPAVIDGLVAVTTGLIAMLPVVASRHSLLPMLVRWSSTQAMLASGLTLAGCAALTLRRRRPVAVLAVMIAVMLAAAPVPSSTKVTSVPLLVALYTVTAHRPRRVWLTGAMASGIALVVAAWPTTRSFVVVTGLVWPVAAAAIGVAVANRRLWAAAVEARALHAEATREQEAYRRVVAERLRIARELHDVLAHGIAVISVQSGMAAHLIRSRPEQAQEALWTIHDASHAALAELRTTIGLLRDPDESAAPCRPQPDLSQLEELLDRVRASGLTVHTKLSVGLADLPPDVGLVSYRVLQEALTNVLKHARARTVNVTAEADRHQVRLVVNDDGLGCVALATNQGHGRLGMRERVRALGGQLQDGPREVGYEVRAVIPLATARDSA
jgi:signal transduction histidine kinase